MIEYIQDNDKTIECSTGMCVVVSGIAKGTAFIKKKWWWQKHKEIPFESLPEELKDFYKKYNHNKDAY